MNDTASSIIRLALSHLLPAAATFGVHAYRKAHPDLHAHRWKWQLACGVIFALVSVLCTALGFQIRIPGLEGMQVTASYGAPVSAGLLFGGPAGLIAGLLSAALDSVLGLYGNNAALAAAGATATAIAGAGSSALRKYIFERTEPAWYYAFLVGAVVTCVHMLLFVTASTDNLREAFTVVRVSALPQILLNGASAALAAAVVRRNAKKQPGSGPPPLSRTFVDGLGILVVCAFAASTVFTWVLETQFTIERMRSLLTLSIEDVTQDIADDLAIYMQDAANTIAAQIRVGARVDTTDELSRLAAWNDVGELVVIDETGQVVQCTSPQLDGTHVPTGVVHKLSTGDTPDTWVASGKELSLTDGAYYTQAAIDDTRTLLAGFTHSSLNDSVRAAVAREAGYVHIEEQGGVLITTEDGRLVSATPGIEAWADALRQYWRDEQTDPDTLFEVHLDRQGDAYAMYEPLGSYRITAVVPEREAFTDRGVAQSLSLFVDLIIYSLEFVLIFYLVRKRIVDRMHRTNSQLAKITDGELSTVVDVADSREFQELSNGINATVAALRRYIGEAEARIEQELELARAIQCSAVPTVFPESDEYSLYALMRTAKQVGGDFYDFYSMGQGRLVVLIADVSDKGIPAALFMMKAKTLLKSLMETGLSLGAAFERANNELCTGNDAGMFVTAWMGLLDLESGCVQYVNAGHLPPYAQTGPGAEFTALSQHPPGLVLGAMENVRYREHEFTLDEGACIFLCTDGVTEAVDSDKKMYGDARLSAVLNAHRDSSMKELCEAVLHSVDSFAGQEPQFDDITMLALRRGRAAQQD